MCVTEISEVGDIKTGGEYLYSLSVKWTQVFTINFQFPILANQNGLLTSCMQDIRRKYWLILNWKSVNFITWRKRHSLYQHTCDDNEKKTQIQK